MSVSIKFAPSFGGYPLRGIEQSTVVYLLTEDGQKAKLSQPLPFSIDLVTTLNESVIPSEISKQIMQIGPENHMINVNGESPLKIVFLNPSSTFNIPSFRVRFSCTYNNQSTQFITDCIMVVDQLLKITDTLPTIFYRNEGGRDNAMDITVQLVDSNGSLLIGRSISLKAVLLYENCARVGNQKLLKVNCQGSGVFKIDSDTGIGKIRVRIEDVSKNHQNQKFIVQVSADPSKEVGNANVAPVSTTPVMVRSKRNRRPTSKGRATTRASSSRHHSHNGLSSQHSVNFVSGVPSKVSGFQTPPPLAPSLLSQNNSSTNASNANDSVSQPVFNENYSKSRLMHLSENAMNSIIPVSSDSSDVKESLKSLAVWHSMTTMHMSQLEWCIIGFEVNEHGSIDINRPIKRCPSCLSQWNPGFLVPSHKPNCVLSQIINIFKDGSVPKAIGHVTSTVNELQQTSVSKQQQQQQQQSTRMIYSPKTQVQSQSQPQAQNQIQSQAQDQMNQILPLPPFPKPNTTARNGFETMKRPASPTTSHDANPPNSKMGAVVGDFGLPIHHPQQTFTSCGPSPPITFDIHSSTHVANSTAESNAPITSFDPQQHQQQSFQMNHNQVIGNPSGNGSVMAMSMQDMMLMMSQGRRTNNNSVQNNNNYNNNSNNNV